MTMLSSTIEAARPRASVTGRCNTPPPAERLGPRFPLADPWPPGAIISYSCRVLAPLAQRCRPLTGRARSISRPRRARWPYAALRLPLRATPRLDKRDLRILSAMGLQLALSKGRGLRRPLRQRPRFSGRGQEPRTRKITTAISPRHHRVRAIRAQAVSLLPLSRVQIRQSERLDRRLPTQLTQTIPRLPLVLPVYHLA